MTKTKAPLAIALCMTCVWVLIDGDVWALTITSTQYGGIIFQDHFERNAIGDAPDSPNSASPGEWENTRGDDVVINDATPGRAPSGGSKYLRVTRPQESENYARFVDVTSGVLTVDYWLNIPATSLDENGNAVATPDFAYGGGNSGLVLGLLGLGDHDGDAGTPDDFRLRYFSGGWQTTDLAITPDKWHRVVATINLDTETSKVSIDGQSSGALPFGGSLTAPINHFNFRNSNTANVAQTFYIDGVPEPTSALLLLVGLIGFARIQRRG